MQTFKHILLATDFGALAEHAGEAAISLARPFDAELTLLHVHSIATYYGYGEGLYWPMEALEREAQKALDRAVGKLKELYPRAFGVLDVGDPCERILAVAEAQRVDLIVMGTHGRRGLSHFVLGSVAEKVVRGSTVPVLTVAARHGAPRRAA
jgi:nucleotide-binding universal stress UspA family protein